MDIGRSGGFIMTASPGSAATDHPVVDVGPILSFRRRTIPCSYGRFQCARAAKPMNSRRFRCRGYWSSDEIPCSFPC
jgi:hypothetical protein